jgi:DNA-nicking Smr family endonuclease
MRELERNTHPDASHRSEPCTSTAVPLQLPAYHPDNTPALAANEALKFKKPGLSNRNMHKYFKHPFNPDITLDLHHHHGEAAYYACQTLLQNCYQQKLRSCRIICGLGHRETNLSKMKGVAVYVLTRTPFVIAFQSADARAGGLGAIDILLQRHKI